MQFAVLGYLLACIHFFPISGSHFALCKNRSQGNSSTLR
jgi:hypothetical protein